MHKHTLRFFVSLITFVALAIPSVAAEGATIHGIELTSASNAVGVRWQTPVGGETVDHYKVYYAKESIIAGNGRYLGSAETVGNQTSLVLLDLENRGFANGETIFVTVTAIDDAGQESLEFNEEKSAIVQTRSGTPHNAATVKLENAIAENESLIRLVFTAPMAMPEGHPALHFMISAEDGSAVQALALAVDGNSFLITTMPMNVRAKYTITIKDTVLAQDGSTLDPSSRTATFIARGDAEPDQPNQPSPPPTPTTPSQLPPDLTPPEDAANLVLTKTLQNDGNYTVSATWTASINTANDLASYRLYESKNDGKTFIGPTALLGTVLGTRIANIPPGTFTLKLTAADKAENESSGIMATIVLPQTGAATLLLSLAGAGLIALQKNRRKARAHRALFDRN